MDYEYRAQWVLHLARPKSASWTWNQWSLSSAIIFKLQKQDDIVIQESTEMVLVHWVHVPWEWNHATQMAFRRILWWHHNATLCAWSFTMLSHLCFIYNLPHKWNTEIDKAFQVYIVLNYQAFSCLPSYCTYTPRIPECNQFQNNTWELLHPGSLNLKIHKHILTAPI